MVLKGLLPPVYRSVASAVYFGRWVIIPFGMIPKLLEFSLGQMNVKPLLHGLPTPALLSDAGKARSSSRLPVATIFSNGHRSFSAMMGSAYAFARFKRPRVPSPTLLAILLRFFA
jgi:hypothetical protein